MDTSLQLLGSVLRGATAGSYRKLRGKSRPGLVLPFE